jgi:hypothetical protein
MEFVASADNYHVLGKVPTCLFEEIVSYSIPRSYCNFVSTSKRIFSQVRLETRQIYLRSPFSFKFLETVAFREKILRLIKHPERQLFIELEDKLPSETSGDIVIFSLTFKSFHLSLLDDFRFGFHSVRNIVIESARGLWLTSSFPRLENLQSLDLHLYNLTDISNLSHLQSITLRNSKKITNVNCLANVRILKIITFDLLNDVSGLGAIPQLVIKDCPSLSDISPLRDNHSLSILDCIRVKDFHSFTPTNAVSIQIDLGYQYGGTVSSWDKVDFVKWCPKARTIEIRNYNWESIQLGPNVYSLVIDGGYYRRNDASNLTQLHFVTLAGCNLTNVNGLKEVQAVYLVSCHTLVDIKGLGGNKFVSIRDCWSIKDYSSLTTVDRVEIYGSFMKSAKGLEGVSHLTLMECKELLDISMLGNAMYLKLQSIKSLIGCKALVTIARLILFIPIHCWAVIGVNHEMVRLTYDRFVKYEDFFPAALFDKDINPKKKIITFLRKNSPK